jgi:thioredoxin 2
MLISCPHCQATNRIPDGKLSAQPTCGKCKQPMADGQVFSLHTSALDKMMVNSEFPMVVDFWAPWCGPCRQFAPTFEQVAKGFAGKAHFIKINTEEEQALSARLGIRSIPTLMIIKQGKITAQMAGALPPADFQRWVAASL